MRIALVVGEDDLAILGLVVVATQQVGHQTDDGCVVLDRGPSRSLSCLRRKRVMQWSLISPLHCVACFISSRYRFRLLAFTILLGMVAGISVSCRTSLELA